MDDTTSPSSPPQTEPLAPIQEGRRRWGAYPDDPEWFVPKAAVYGTLVVAVMLAIFAFFGSIAWMAHHHDVLIDEYTGEWAGRGDSLSIQQEYRVDEPSAYASDRPTGSLLIAGSLGGRTVRATVDIDDFPPWVYAVRFRQDGREWVVTVDQQARTMSVVADDGTERRLVRQAP